MDSTGISALICDMMASLRSRGTAAIVGASALGTTAALDVTDIMQNCKTLIGVVEGDSVPSIFIPVLIDLYMVGKFPFDKLVKFYDFDDINQAAEDSEKGVTLKPIIKISATDDSKEA